MADDSAELQRELEQLRARLRSLEDADFARFAQFAVENLSDAVYWMTEDASIIYANEAASQLTGYCIPELLKMKVYELNADLNPAGWSGTWALLKAAGKRTFEARHRHKDGHILEVEIAANFLEFGGTEYSLAFVRDIHERKALELRLRHAEKMEAIGRLAGGVAHDFNNQLTAITGYSELLKHAVEGNPKATGFVEELSAVVRRASDLTAQLLAFSRRGKFLQEPVDLHAVLGEAVTMLSRSLDRRIRIDTHLAAERAWTLGDPSQLQSAIVNLALNARDAMPDGGTLTLATANTELDAAQGARLGVDLPVGRYIVLTLRDTGVGMDEETRERLFEPFFTTKEAGAGTGLGLAAVYGAIRNHKGAITVDSEPGHGSVFTLYLPVSRPGTGRRSEGDEPVSMRLHGHVLVVDDEATARNVVGQMLESLGCTVTTCESGEEALEIFRGRSDGIDLVLLDIVMPGMGGPRTFAAMREIDPDVDVLVISGYSVDGEAQSMIDGGARGFLQKPFTMSALAAKIDALLKR